MINSIKELLSATRSMTETTDPQELSALNMQNRTTEAGEAIRKEKLVTQNLVLQYEKYHIGTKDRTRNEIVNNVYK